MGKISAEKTNVHKSGKQVGILGFPCDLGAGQEGASLAPFALRNAGIVDKLQNLGWKTYDEGDLVVPLRRLLQPNDMHLKYFSEIIDVSEKLAYKACEILQAHDRLVILGGDHTTAIGSLAGISKFCRQKNNKPLAVVWIDAHTDMNTEKTTPSGNIHGMSLAISMGMGVSSLVDLLGFSPKVRPQDCFVLGVRSVDIMESKTVKETGVHILTMADMDRVGWLERFIDFVQNIRHKGGHLHVSFDVDGLDPGLAPGTGTPVPGGLTYREIHTLMEIISQHGGADSVEITEVNPLLDHANQTARLAVDIVGSLFGKTIL